MLRSIIAAAFLLVPGCGAPYRDADLFPKALAAAHQKPPHAKDLVVGLDAAEKAWALDHTPAAAWTRAVLLSWLASEDVAVRGWDDYLALDRTSPRAAEARRRRNQWLGRPGRLVKAGLPPGIVPVQTGSRAIEQYDRMLEQLLRVGRDDRAAMVLLARAEALYRMRAADEAWADLLKARNQVSGGGAAVEEVQQAIARAALRDGYVHAARVLGSGRLGGPGQLSLVKARFASAALDAVELSIGGDAVTRRTSRFSLDDIAEDALAEVAAKSVQDLYERQANIEIADGSPEAALWLSDRARLVPLGRRNRCADTDRDATIAVKGRQLAQCVPPGVTLVQQDLDEDRLHTWVVRDGTLTFQSTPVSSEPLRARIQAFRGDIREARQLYDILLRPVERQIAGAGALVYSPSRALSDVPPGALHDGTAFLIQRRLVTTTETISSFALPKASARTASALIVLPDAASPVKELPGARREVRAVNQVYGVRGALLTGGEATPEAFLGSAAEYDIIHVATHGDSSDLPYRNGIDFGVRRIRAFDVFSLRLKRTPLVILSACRTANEGDGPTNVSVANAFLRAGASVVIGSVWDVDDDETAEFSVAFHRELANGATPQDALRKVQLDFIRRRKPVSAWAAFQVSS